MCVVGHDRHLSRARHAPDDVAVQSQRRPSAPLRRSRFGLDHDFLGRIIQQPDSDVRVVQSLFQFFRDLGEHFIRVERGNDVAGNVVEQRQVARFRPLLAEQPRIFQSDDRFAGQHAHHFQVPDVERAFLGTLQDHGSDGPLVQQQRHAAEAALVRILRFQTQLAHFFGVIFADQDGLARAHQVFDRRGCRQMAGTFWAEPRRRAPRLQI